MVAAVIKISCVDFCQDAGPELRQPRVRGSAFGRPCTEVNVADIPAVSREHVRSLTGTIQIYVLGSCTDSVCALIPPGGGTQGRHLSELTTRLVNPRASLPTPQPVAQQALPVC